MPDIFDNIHEECGVFGVYDTEGRNVAPMVYYGLFSLQHRGQESCGIAVSDRGVVSYHKDMGLVGEVFAKEELQRLTGDIAIGHVRYSTTGSSVRSNAQPLVTHYVKGWLAVAHNGNLINNNQIRREMQSKGLIFHTSVDSEVISYLIAQARVHTRSIEEAMQEVIPQLHGAYSLVIISPRKLVAVRDPYGFRPLCIGKCGSSYIVASETCALDSVGAEFIRDVKPGETILIDKNGLRTVACQPAPKASRCIFEYIYFARPDSVIDGVSVCQWRENAGRALARLHPVDADIVCGVPDSGLDAALGYSMESGIPYSTAFVKSKYIGRTFIAPDQSMRERAVHLKLNVNKYHVNGKRVVLIDDSIVRGTTSVPIIKMLRDAGATEVHMRVTAPPFRYPCFFGTDIPDSDHLVAYKSSVEEIAQKLGVDSLGYLSLDSLREIMGSDDYCDGCFTGKYAMPIPDPEPEDVSMRPIE